MDFMSGRDGGFPDHQDDPKARGKLPFSYSSSQSSSPISSSPNHQYRAGTPALISLGWDAQIYDNHGPDTKLELMESEDDAIRRGEQSRTSTNAPEAEAEAAADHHHQRIEWEHMFDKVVTPSDVGKLNRLVIPKQHAEKYFPLHSTTNEKGLLLNFEDRNGKPWRFRYSYWNSSQSYVMTKGWSRFVKEKKLDAGDIVSFQRGVGRLGKGRLYIDWRRRPDAVVDPLVGSQLPNYSHRHHHYLSFHQRRGASSSSILPWSPLLMRPPPPPPPPPNYGHVYRNTDSSYGFGNVTNPVCSGPIYYLRSGVPVQEEQVPVQPQTMPMVFQSVPVVHGKAAAKRLRLFGVNMECPISESSDEQCDVVLSPSTIPRHANATIAATHEQPLQEVSSPSQSQSPHQLRLYNGTPLPVPTIDFFNKGNASMSTLDFDI